MHNNSLVSNTNKVDSMSSSQMDGKLFAVAVAALMLAAGASVLLESADAEADTSFSVTYTLSGTEYTVSYDGPDDYIIIFGYALGKTVDQTGMNSKIVMADKYANNALEEDGYDRMDTELPSLYSSGNVDQIYATILQAKEDGTIDTGNTTIVLTTYFGNCLTLKDKLNEAGFDHVLFYGSITTYDQVVSCVADIENVVGSELGLADSMTETYDDVTAAVSGAEEKDIICLWYSSSYGWGAKQSGLAVTLAETAGGNNIGYTSDATSGTYYNEQFIIQALASSPDAVICLDSGYIRNGYGTLESFVSDFMGGSLGDHTLFVCEQEWNNYDPQFADGLKAFAAALHPDLYSDSDVTVYTQADFDDDSGGSNAVLYAVGAIAVAVVLVGAFLWMRSRH